VAVVLFGVLALSFGASAASAETSCWRLIQNEWVNGQAISTTYPLSCYREAIEHVPEDLRQYSSIEEDIRAARQLAASRRTLQSANSPDQPSTAAQDRGPKKTLFTKSLNKLGPDNADSVPLPLLILAGLALLLIAAGAAGLVSRRLKARRVPSPYSVRGPF
jgi:hypothetical protein